MTFALTEGKVGIISSSPFLACFTNCSQLATVRSETVQSYNRAEKKGTYDRSLKLWPVQSHEQSLGIWEEGLVWYDSPAVR